MSRLTPPIQATGRYVLKPPFVARDDIVYTCIAIRKFKDIIELGIDVFKEYYEPMGLTQLEYRADDRAGATIVTLSNPDGEFIYVPDTYILSYPNMGDVNYSRVILSIDLGPLADHIPLDFLQSEVSGLVSDTIGLENEVKIHKAPSRDAISPEQHEIIEVARVSAITNRRTARANYLEEKAKNQRLTEQVQLLTQILIDRGLLPPNP